MTHAHELLHGDEVVHAGRGVLGRVEAEGGRRPGGREDGMARGDGSREAQAAGKGARGGPGGASEGLARAKVEHPFLYLKRHFGCSKARYGGLAKNLARVALLLGFTNPLTAGRYATG